MTEQNKLSNEEMRSHKFLQDMYEDDYFPNHLVNKASDLLVALCHKIETHQPSDLAALYQLTQATTIEFNELQEAFFEAESEFETVAREIIAEDFEAIASAYGFDEADVEELIETRDW